MASKWLLMLPGVRHRPDQAEVLGQVGQARVQLADAHAGDRRGDRLVRAANLRRRRRLEVPGVEVAGAAAQQDEDARLVGGAAARSAHRIDAGRHHAGQAQVQEAGPAELEQSAARDRDRVHRDSSGGRRVMAGTGSLQDTPRTVVRHHKSREREGTYTAAASVAFAGRRARPLTGHHWRPGASVTRHVASRWRIVSRCPVSAFMTLRQHAKSSLWTVSFLTGRRTLCGGVPLNGSCGPPAIVPRGGGVWGDQNGGEMGVNKGR